MHLWRTVCEHGTKLWDPQNAGNVFTTAGRNAFWRRTAVWRHVYTNLLHFYVRSLSLGSSLRHTNQCHWNSHRNPLRFNYKTSWYSINSSFHWQPPLSIFLKCFELTVLELSKQNILPAVYTQPTLNVTTPPYLVRKQWCSASWLPCLIIPSPGRPIFSQNREYLSEIKANESQTTRAKGWKHRSEVAETFIQYVPTSKLGPGKTLSKLRISVSLLSTYRKIPGLCIKSDYDRFLHQPFQFAAYLLLYTFHTMIITEQTNLIPTSCTSKNERQCTRKLTLRHVREAIVAGEKQ
jgi:hypothetical protein